MALTKVIGSGLGAIPAISGANLTGLTDSQMPAGSVVQVVTASHDSRVDSTSTSFADTGLTCNITPSSSSNKVMVIVSQNLGQDRNSGTATGDCKLLRDTTSIYEMDTMSFVESGGSSAKSIVSNSITVLDSPSTTSQITYKTQIACNDTSSSGTSRANWGGPSIMTLMEVVG